MTRGRALAAFAIMIAPGASTPALRRQRRVRIDAVARATLRMGLRASDSARGLAWANGWRIVNRPE